MASIKLWMEELLACWHSGLLAFWSWLSSLAALCAWRQSSGSRPADSRRQPASSSRQSKRTPRAACAPGKRQQPAKRAKAAGEQGGQRSQRGRKALRKELVGAHEPEQVLAQEQPPARQSADEQPPATQFLCEQPPARLSAGEQPPGQRSIPTPEPQQARRAQAAARGEASSEPSPAAVQQEGGAAVTQEDLWVPAEDGAAVQEAAAPATPEAAGEGKEPKAERAGGAAAIGAAGPAGGAPASSAAGAGQPAGHTQLVSSADGQPAGPAVVHAAPGATPDRLMQASLAGETQVRPGGAATAGADLGASSRCSTSTEPAAPPAAPAAAQGAEEAPGGPSVQVTAASDEDEGGAAAECVMCMDAPRDAVLLPCGHCALCTPCARWLMAAARGGRPLCPLCRHEVSAHIRVFYA